MVILLATALLNSIHSTAAERSVTVCTYNLENYCDTATTRGAKSVEAREAACTMILKAKPDVLVVQELCSPEALSELQTRLRNRGLNLPETEYVTGPDPFIHIAVLTSHRIISRNPLGTARTILPG